MTRAQMLAELREVLGDRSIPYGWSDTRLEGYLAEGQDKFCEKTGYFKDTSNFTIVLETDVAIYPIPDRIIEVFDIWNGTVKLKKTLVDDYAIEPEWPAISATGMPNSWRADQETGSIMFNTAPTIAENEKIFILQVWRYSLFDLAGDGATSGTAALPEIPSRFQRACIEWAAYKAFNRHDEDYQDAIKAADHLRGFDMYVLGGKAALRRIQGAETRVGTNPAYRT